MIADLMTRGRMALADGHVRHYGGFVLGGVAAFTTDATILALLTRLGGLSPFLARPRVLLVDDEVLVANGLARSLSNVADVTVASSVASALGFLEHQEFDAVVSDFDMPGRNGLSLLAEVARRWPRLKRVLHSGAMPDEAQAALSSGVVHELIAKPAQRDVLIAALATPSGTR